MQGELLVRDAPNHNIRRWNNCCNDVCWKFILVIWVHFVCFPNFGKVLKTDFRKSSIYGILSSVVIFVCLYGAFSFFSKSVSYKYDGSFSTQMEQEEREQDYKIEYEKNKIIQKSVDNFKP